MAKRTSKTANGEPKQDLYILISETREHGYLHLYGRVVTQRYEQGSPQPYSPDDQYGDGPLYSGLRLACQGDDHSRQRAIAGERDAPVYGYDCEYREVFSVNRRHAVRMAATLTTLERKLSKLDDSRGYVRTYGEYVGRVAEALGCVGLAFDRDHKSREVTGTRWRWDSVGYGVQQIDRRIDQWVEEARPKPAAAPAAAETVDANDDAAREVA